MANNNPSVDDFKTYFIRDFPFGTDISTSILDTDIVKAFNQVNAMINQNLFDNQGTYTIGYLLLSAHFLVINLRASSQGISGQFSWLQNSRGAGSVSEGIAIPQRILDNPGFSMLSKTNYGAQFLEMIIPQICGNMFIACGHTKA